MESIELEFDDFQEHLQKVVRVWDGQEGLTTKRALQKGIEPVDLKYIFVRNDGWSVACKEQNKDSCQNLYSDSWESIYTYKS